MKTHKYSQPFLNGTKLMFLVYSKPHKKYDFQGHRVTEIYWKKLKLFADWLWNFSCIEYLRDW